VIPGGQTHLNSSEKQTNSAKKTQLNSMASLMDTVSGFFSGADTKTSEGLRDLFVNGLNEMYDSEQKQIGVIEARGKSATTDEVRSEILKHGEETRQHVARLEQVYQSIGEQPHALGSGATDGIASDAKKVEDKTEAGTLTRDAGLIIAGQKGEHFEIAAYGSLHTLAETLGYTEAAQLLEQTLSEEKAADERLTQLAKAFVNRKAAEEGTH
jgi:ferritin-like metal-binding protein YciE